MPERKYLTRKQAAEYLGISVKTLGRRVNIEKKIPVYADGAFVRFSLADLDAYMDSLRIVPQAQSEINPYQTLRKVRRPAIKEEKLV